MTKNYTCIYSVKQRDGSIIFICQLGDNVTQDINEVINLDDLALCGLPFETLESIVLPALLSVLGRVIYRFIETRGDHRFVNTMLDGDHSAATRNLENEANQFMQGQKTVRTTLASLRYNIHGDPTRMPWVSSDGLPISTSPFQTQQMVDAIQAVLEPDRLLSQHPGEVSFLTIGRTLESLFHELDTHLHLSGHVGEAWGPISVGELLHTPNTSQLLSYLDTLYQQSNGNFERLVHHLVQPTPFPEASNGFEVLYHLNNVASVIQATSELTDQNTPVLQVCSQCTNQQIQTLQQFLTFDYYAFLQNNREGAIQLGQSLRLHYQGQQERPNTELRLHQLLGNNVVARQKLKAYILEPSKPSVPYVSVNTIPFDLMTFLSVFAVRQLFGMRTGMGNLPVQQPRPAPRFPEFRPFPLLPDLSPSQMMDDIRNRFQHVPWSVVRRLFNFTVVGGLTITNPMFLPALVHVLPHRQREGVITLLKEILKQLTKKP
jgi:hypothetical protein